MPSRSRPSIINFGPIRAGPIRHQDRARPVVDPLLAHEARSGQARAPSRRAAARLLARPHRQLTIQAPADPRPISRHRHDRERPQGRAPGPDQDLRDHLPRVVTLSVPAHRWHVDGPVKAGYTLQPMDRIERDSATSERVRGRNGIDWTARRGGWGAARMSSATMPGGRSGAGSARPGTDTGCRWPLPMSAGSTPRTCSARSIARRSRSCC